MLLKSEWEDWQYGRRAVPEQIEIICIYTLFSPYAWAVIGITTATIATSKAKDLLLKA